MLKKICATLLLLLTILHPKVEKTSLSKTKFNINTIHLKWEPKEFHLSWIKDSLTQPIPNNQWNIQWESQPLHPGIAGITRLIGERQILIDLNPMWKWDWDHVYMHELIHAKQIQDGRLEIKNYAIKFFLYGYALPQDGIELHKNYFLNFLLWLI